VPNGHIAHSESSTRSSTESAFPTAGRGKPLTLLPTSQRQRSQPRVEVPSASARCRCEAGTCVMPPDDSAYTRAAASRRRRPPRNISDTPAACPVFPPCLALPSRPWDCFLGCSLPVTGEPSHPHEPSSARLRQAPRRRRRRRNPFSSTRGVPSITGRCTLRRGAGTASARGPRNLHHAVPFTALGHDITVSMSIGRGRAQSVDSSISCNTGPSRTDITVK